MRLTDHVTLSFNNNMSTAAVFLDIEKAFDTIWYLGLLYQLSKLIFSIRKFRVSVEGEMSSPRDIQAVVPEGSVLPPTLYSMYVNDTSPNTWRLPRSLR
jgi:hypothetical protein